MCKRPNTLRGHFQDFRVDDHLRRSRRSLRVPFLGLAPQVGPAVHAGNVQDSDSLKRQAAEVEGSAAALSRKQVAETEESISGPLGGCFHTFFSSTILTSIVRFSLSFLQEAEMVSEVANSKYQSLFFILQS